MPKKAFITILLLFALMFRGATTIFADNTPTDTTIEDSSITPSTTTNDRETNPPAWGPSYDKAQMDAYWRAVHEDNCATPSLECLVHQTSRFVAIEWVNNILYPGNKGNAKTSNLQKQTSSSFIEGITYLMSEMYRHPVARTSIYVADVLENAHIITPAYAQGLGFASLNPILELWKTFRNIAYLAFVFIIIIIGFMIMFRQKIGGQTAVTAQQAIPNIIIGLILVTFSYAIAGFLIDMMYLLMFMIIGIFGQTAPQLDAGIVDYSITKLMGTLFTNVSSFDANLDIVTNIISGMISTETSGSILGIIGGLTLSLVLAIAILISTVKLFFELLKSYTTIVLSVVTAPLVLLGGAFPGKNSFKPWLMNIIGNLSAFPTVLMTVILFFQFTNKATGADTSGGFVPPFLLGRGQSGAITTLMGLAIILALPEIVKEVKKKLGATEGFGTMIFNEAGRAATKGWKGGELIEGTGIRMPGAKQVGTTIIMGSKKSREKYQGTGNDYLRLGLIGGGYEMAKTTIENIKNKHLLKTTTQPANTATTPSSNPNATHSTAKPSNKI